MLDVHYVKPHSGHSFVKALSIWMTMLGLLWPQASHSEISFKLPFCKSLLETLEARVERSDNFKVPKKWQPLMTRSNEVKNENYLRNITRSTFKDFAPWFLKRSQDDFQTMLRQQHISTIQGEGKGQEYLSVTGNVKEAAQLAPGKFRSDADYPAPEQRELINLREQVLRQIQFPRIILKYMSRQEQPPSPELEGIPKEFWTKRESIEYSDKVDPFHRKPMHDFIWLHAYAEAKAIPIYLEQMESIMSELRDMPKTKENRKAAVMLLARYHQLFVSALPFARVNNSIAMAHVNYVLLSFGMNGIPHDFLDLLCLVISTKQYQGYFFEAVRQTNPKL